MEIFNNLMTRSREKFSMIVIQGQIQHFWKGGSYVLMCGGFALLILSYFLKYPMKMK